MWKLWAAWQQPQVATNGNTIQDMSGAFAEDSVEGIQGDTIDAV